MGMTETDLLGTALLEVGTDISRIQLDAEEFGLSAPARATITIAAGDGAVGEELARVGLTVVDEAVVAAIKGLGNDIVGKLSLEAFCLRAGFKRWCFIWKRVAGRENDGGDCGVDG